jgi:hypothetical protein
MAYSHHRIDDDETVSPLLEEEMVVKAQDTNTGILLSRTATLWKTTTAVLSVLSLILISLLVVLLHVLSSRHCLIDSYEYGFQTDFHAAAKAIKLEQRRFTHSIRFNSSGSGSLYPMFLRDREPLYAGLPSSEIDNNWAKLIGGRYFRFKTDEVIDLQENDKSLPVLNVLSTSRVVAEEGVYGGVDMEHSLHCVNALRMHLDKEYYSDQFSLPELYERMHIGKLSFCWHVYTIHVICTVANEFGNF